jgi:peptidoglycan hydrolase-like protein with peptidoglycan-binding domain
MKKLVGSIVGLSLLAMPIVGMAQTTNAQIQAMLTQIQALQSQIQALKTAQAQVASSTTNVMGTLKLIRNLKQGMSGEDVSALQAILAADPTLYPEGLVSGFYGALTARAVAKFQSKHGFEAVGFVGPKTLKKLNEEFDNLGLSFENSSSTGNGAPGHNGGNKLCIPPGHMIAPGWLKKNNKPVPTASVPLCNSRGNGDKGNNPPATTTPDTTAPIISSITNSSGQTSGTVYWTTNELSTTKVYYATTSAIDVNATSTLSVNNASLVVNHGIAISGLNPSTTYYFVVESKDPVGNTATSSVNSFVTTAAPDTTAPIISAIGTLNLMGTTTSIIWTTNEVATNKVWFGTTNPLNLASSTLVSNSDITTSHSLGLSGLATSTTYYYVVVSADTTGNIATSSQNSFLTTAGL